jgi:TPR repeat protein
MDRDPDTLAWRAVDLYRADRYAEALEISLSLAQSPEAPPWLLSMIGTMYSSGQGTAPNHQEAMSWFHRAADAGDPGALTYLARFALLNGRYDDARAMLEDAASQGHGRALLTLGYVYDRGLGVPRDRKRARDYFEQAAADGYIFGKRFIAVQLLRGDDGLFAIPKGLVMFVGAAVELVRARLKDHHSDKILW